MKCSFSLWLRLSARLCLGLGLVCGLCLALGHEVRSAHAQSTVTVSSCSASALDSALSQAQASSGNTIQFACSGDILIDQALTITTTLTIDGSNQQVTLDGHQQYGVFQVNAGASLTLNALTISNGFGSPNANFGGNVGGGIANFGTLNISNSTLSGNAAQFGGGILNEGTVSINNSTLSGNAVYFDGGGLYNDNGGTVNISNSTLSGNAVGYFGGGILNRGTVSSSGSIVAENTGSDCNNVFGTGTVTDQGYNLDSDNSCFTAPTSLHTNPLLSGLANNGGSTQTLALQQGSPAIDQIPVASCPSSDQRGMTRPDDSETSCDIGAYESKDTDLGLKNMPANLTVNATSPQGAVVTYTPPTVMDEESPLPTVNCSPASGSTFAIGTTTINCTVTDTDDTPSSVSQSFTVTVNGASTQISNLISLVNSFHLSGSLQNSLDVKLNAALKAVNAGQTGTACSDLADEIGQVQSQSGKGLTVSQANQLIAAAKQVQAVLGC